MCIRDRCLSLVLKSRFCEVSLFFLQQVIESLALEDTDIKTDHIPLIKELIKKEDLVTPEEEKQVVDT